jgi:hypothetical protein
MNEIISVFLDQNVNQLSDNNLSIAIEAKGKICSTEEIRRVVQSSGWSLFQLRFNKEGIYLVHIEPKVNLLYYFNHDQDCILDQYMSRLSRWQMCSKTGSMQSTSFMPIFWSL